MHRRVILLRTLKGGEKMSAKEMLRAYIKQSGPHNVRADHQAHTNGSTHTNCSGSHTDTGQLGGGGHGNHNDSRNNYGY